MTNASGSTRLANPMPGPSNRTALLVWIGLLGLLIPLFAFLAGHPGWFLAAEKEQPSRCLVEARNLAEVGRYDDALSALGRGLSFYNEQLDKTGSPSHRMTVATIYHSMGLILLKRDRPGDRERAEQRFRQGVETAPTVGRGEGQLLLAGYERQRNPVSALARYAGVVAAVSDAQAVRARGRSADILAELGRREEALKAYEDYINFSSGEPDLETSNAFAAIAEQIASGTGSALARSYLQLNQREKAKAQLQAAASLGDPVARWYLSEVLESTDGEINGILFDPRHTFAASMGINSVSFTWPAGCVVEFVAGKRAGGQNLVVTLQPDRLRPQTVQLPTALNGKDAGVIEVSRGGPTDYETTGALRSGRNVLVIRCAMTWFEPDDAPVITLLGLKPGSRAAAK